MSKQVFIFLHDASPDNMEWLIHTGNEFSNVYTDKHDELKNEAKHSSVVAILPTRDFSFFRVNIPAKTENNFIKAVPYALEEKLIGSIDNLFFAVGEKEEQRGVWVISHSRMQAYLSVTEELEIDVTHIIPESALMQHSDSYCSLWFKDDKATLCHKDSIISLASDKLALVIDNYSPEEQLTTPSCEVMDFTGEAQELLSEYQNKDTLLFTHNSFSPSHYLPSLARRFLDHTPINLLQGKYRQGIELNETFKLWQPVTILLTLLLIFQLVTITLDNMAISAQIQSVDEEINQQYKKVFPKINNASIAKSKMQQVMNALKSNTTTTNYRSFSFFLSDVGKILLNIPELSIEKISYKKPTLKLTLEAKSIELIDKVSEKITKKGYQSNVISIAHKDGLVIATIQVSQ